MGGESVQKIGRAVWALQGAQHGVVTREQLLGFGLGHRGIEHRLVAGRLHSVRRGVYAVGRPQLTRLGALSAAVLAAGEGAHLTHRSAAELWGVGPQAAFEVTVPARRNPRRAGITIHRRDLDPNHLTRRHNIAVTGIVCTLVDLATTLRGEHLERAVTEADRLDLIDPERLRSQLDGFAGHHGVPKLRALLDRRTFTVTQSRLERRFKPIARAAGLPLPQTQRHANGFRVDFLWPDLGVVVETDGLRYHRTAAQQAKDMVRDQAHLAKGLLPLGFTHAQVVYEAAYVAETLREVVLQLRGERGFGRPATRREAAAPR